MHFVDERASSDQRTAFYFITLVLYSREQRFIRMCIYICYLYSVLIIHIQPHFALCQRILLYFVRTPTVLDCVTIYITVARKNNLAPPFVFEKLICPKPLFCDLNWLKSELNLKTLNVFQRNYQITFKLKQRNSHAPNEKKTIFSMQQKQSYTQ